MDNDTNFLRTIANISKIITPIDSTIPFPEILDVLIEKYDGAIAIIKNKKTSRK